MLVEKLSCNFSFADGVKSMMDKVAALSTQINGLNDVKVMVGRSGATNGMKILIKMVLASNRGKHGGKVSTEKGGTVHGARATTVQAGFTSMERAAVGSIGTHTNSRKPGMRDSHTSGFIIASTIQSSSGKFRNHLRRRKLLQ